MFIGFANFYWHFIRGFSKIAALFTSLLKTTGSSGESALKAFRANNNKIVEFGNKANGTVVNLSKNKKFRKSTCMPNIRVIRKSNFLTPDAKKGL